MAGKDPTAIKALHEVEKRLNCAVCLDLLTEPKSLPCLHSFCEKCLGNLALLPQRRWLCSKLPRLPKPGPTTRRWRCWFFQCFPLERLFGTKTAAEKVVRGEEHHV